MLELLSPASDPESVIAAVQSGADTVYMRCGADADGRTGFSRDELARCLRYCRVRGCRAAVEPGGLMTDNGLDDAAQLAVRAAREGADAFVVQDIGLLAVLQKLLPDIPLWGGVRMGVHSLDGARLAAAMGLRRILLAPELSREQLAYIAENAPIETAVCVHGPLCFSHMGQCRMSAMASPRHSDGALRCAEPCRGRFSLGGRLDDRPLSMPDTCLIGHLAQLEETGVTCAVIGGRRPRPEYVAFMTGIYARAIHEKAAPEEDELERLRTLFAPHGLTDRYFSDGTVAPAPAPEPEEAPPPERELADIRRSYMEGELRRVPVTFYVVIRQEETAVFAAEDDRGHRAVYEGYAPVDLGRQGITPERVREILYRTGGTPYYCADIKCAVDPNMDYADELIEQARRALLSQLTAARRDPRPVEVGQAPPPLAENGHPDPPKLIVSLSRGGQLSRELAELAPDYLYLPAETLAAAPPLLEAFRERGTRLAAVLPQVVSDEEKPVLTELLATLRDLGVEEVLAGSLGLIGPAFEAGLVPRGDLGLNLTNARAAQSVCRMGLKSVTASVELSARQIRGLARAADTEMIVYGRVPVMLTEQCLIRNSAGRCACTTPASMSDPFGNVYPVDRQFGCRNVIYDRRKLFLADRPESYESAGLWGIRLSFTTESARECAEVTKRYRGLNRYLPNNVGHGLYQKGAI